MTKTNKTLHNILLALGILLFLAGVVLIFLPPVGQRETYHLFMNATFLLITAALVYVSLLLKNYLSFYISLNLCIFSLMVLILMLRSVLSPLRQHWPIMIIILGATLLPIGRIRYKKFLTAYVFPAASLVVLGVFFLLFTFDIIKMRMSVFFGYFLPAFLIMCGASLIAVYYVRQNAKDKFPTISEDEKIDSYDDYIEDDE